MADRTPTQVLASTLLGEDVIAWATGRRADGRPSWRSIATEIRTRTDGKVDVTGEIVRRWVFTSHGCDPAEATTEAVAS